MVFIDSTVVSIALPVLQRDLGATALDALWVVEAYTLMLGALMLLGGALGDRYGRKRIFVLGTAIFATGSALCGLAPSIHFLILARVLQGAGGMLMAPASLALIGAFFEGPARGKAIGTWSALTAVTTAVGPVLGGTVIDHFGWRWVFFFNLPIAIAVIALALRHIPESRDEGERGALDWLGSAMVTLGLGGVVYAFVQSGASGWDGRTIGALIGGVVLLLGFLRTEARVAAPVMPLGIFANRAFSGINAMTFLLYGALGATFYFVPFIMILVDGYSATIAGLAMLPFVALIVTLSRFSGGFAYRIGPRAMLVAGTATTACGFALYGLLPDLHYWSGIFPASIVTGIGMGLTVAPLTATMIESVPQHHVGLASGINNAVSRVAGLLAIAVFGALLASVFNQRLERRIDEAALPPANRAAIERGRAAMAATPVKAPRDRAVVLGAYEDGFRVVAVGCALLAAASTAVAAATLSRGAARPG